jgi:glutaconyl-CoA/methylmalonyl-CoA decarboxylase subunit gamma
MAELTGPEDLVIREDAARPSTAGVQPGAASSATGIVPRAVRVRLASSSRIGEEPALLISPVSQPLRMTNPTVGRGPLGGAAVPLASPDHDPGTVLAQRQPVEVDGVPTDTFLRPAGGVRFVLEVAGAAVRVVLEPAAPAEGGCQRREVLVDGFRFEVETESERIASLRERASRGRAGSVQSGPLEVKAIIPGKVVAVSVAPGDAVMAGQQLLVVEAMKMQNELRAPRDGTISRVGVAPGVNIEVGDLLVVIS